MNFTRRRYKFKFFIMKTISRLRYFLYLSILIVGCTTGKNALQKGNYDASVHKAVDRLRSSPKNTEAQQVLASAYSFALKDHLSKIYEAKLTADVWRWEYILNHYEQLNALANEVNSCAACQELIPKAQQFIVEVKESKSKAAAVRYSRGLTLLNENNRISAKKAYYEFEIAQQLNPNYKDVKTKLDDAYWAAVVKVVVEQVQMNNGNYQLSNQHFQQEINQFMGNYRSNKFIVFYDEKQAAQQQVVPDQVLSLQFNNFTVGQTYVKETVEKMKKDSVIVGYTRTKRPIYGTVKANFSFFDKKISSSGLLSLMITDWDTRKVLKQQELSGTYVWQDNWARYRGDERALTHQQLKLICKREVLPPTPEVLFLEFTKPIYAQLVNEVNYFYNQF
jgi:hypothetical protein